MQRVRYRGPCTCTHVLSESVNMLNRRQQWRRIRPRVVLRTRVPDDITCVSAATYVHVLVARKMRLSWNTTVHFRQIPSAKDIRTSQDPRSRKGEALVVARRPPGFRSRRAESPTARPTEREQASKRNNATTSMSRMPASRSECLDRAPPQSVSDYFLLCLRWEYEN